MIQHLFVWIRRTDGAVQPVGELAMTAPDRNSGRFESEFEYARAWMNQAGAFALDGASGMTRPSGGGCVTQWSRAARCKVNRVHAALVLAFIDDHTINER